MKRKETRTVTAEDPLELGPFITLRFGVTNAKELCKSGAVRVDGRPARAGYERLTVGERVVVFLTDDDAQGGATKSPPVELVTVLKDRDVWIIDKPAGLLSQASPTEREETLARQVEKLAPDARMLHRLDKETSGLVLFAMSERARQSLQPALAAHAVDRRYLAIVGGALEGEGKVTLAIGRDATDGRKRAALPERDPAGEAAVTHYRALGRDDAASALAITLETGRTHQIRVHLASLGHPVLGDTLYGGSKADRLYLHAYQLSFPHPRDGKPCTVCAPTPTEFRSRLPDARWPSL